MTLIPQSEGRVTRREFAGGFDVQLAAEGGLRKAAN